MPSLSGLGRGGQRTPAEVLRHRGGAARAQGSAERGRLEPFGERTSGPFDFLRAWAEERLQIRALLGVHPAPATRIKRPPRKPGSLARRADQRSFTQSTSNGRTARCRSAARNTYLKSWLFTSPVNMMSSARCKTS